MTRAKLLLLIFARKLSLFSIKLNNYKIIQHSKALGVAECECISVCVCVSVNLYLCVCLTACLFY